MISVNNGDDSVCGPAFHERIAPRDAGLRLHGNAGNVLTNNAPADRPELTKSVVLRGKSLEIKQQMLLTFTDRGIARHRAGFGFDKRLKERRNAFAHSFGGENQIARQNGTSGIEQHLSRSLEFAEECLGEAFLVARLDFVLINDEV